MKIRNVKQLKKTSAPLTVKSAGSCCPDGNTTTSDCCQPPQKKSDKAPCCGPSTVITGGQISEKVPGFIKWLETPAGRVPQISTELTFSDHLGACKARWAIGRMSYIVPPGLYAVGAPGPDAPVLVTANYKMSYDILRQQLSGRDLWILVLETFGVNVWCAAGKETFGTDELVSRINRTDLHNIVSHRRLILPILGAPGVAAHQVTKRTGFAISFATIRAGDLPAYLDNGLVTTPEMRKLSFSTYDRMVLVPVEMVMAAKSVAIFGVALFLAALLTNGPSAGLITFLAYLGAVLTGVAVVPILLPWIPGRSFAVKGALAGIAWAWCLYSFSGGHDWHITTAVAAFIALPAVSAFHALNFTGCTTYTSRSGVKKEMRLGIPAMGSAIAAALILLTVGRLI